MVFRQAGTLQSHGSPNHCPRIARPLSSCLYMQELCCTIDVLSGCLAKRLSVQEILQPRAAQKPQSTGDFPVTSCFATTLI